MSVIPYSKHLEKKSRTSYLLSQIYHIENRIYDEIKSAISEGKQYVVLSDFTTVKMRDVSHTSGDYVTVSVSTSSNEINFLGELIIKILKELDYNATIQGKTLYISWADSEGADDSSEKGFGSSGE